MKRIDPHLELSNMITLLDLRPGEIMLDAQTEPDQLLRFAHDRVGARGVCIGLAFGQTTAEEVREQLARWELPNVQLVIGHPAMPLDMKNDRFHGLILRHTGGIPRLQAAFHNLERLAKPGARILVRHTDWNIKLPRVTEREQEMIDALKAPGARDGRDFFAQFENFPARPWRDFRVDVYTVASRDPRQPVRYGYNWRKMMREQLNRARVFEPREQLDLIARLDETRGAKVTVDRYLALAVKG